MAETRDVNANCPYRGRHIGDGRPICCVEKTSPGMEVNCYPIPRGRHELCLTRQSQLAILLGENFGLRFLLEYEAVVTSMQKHRDPGSVPSPTERHVQHGSISICEDGAAN